MRAFVVAAKLSHGSIAALLFAIFLGCGGGCAPAGPGSNGLPDPGLTNVQTENTAAEEATISEDGGTLTVTDSKGIVYTLTIPEGALLEETVIGMYPVTEVTTLPADAQVAGGVHLVPDGLQLQLSATLIAELPAGTDLLSIYAVTYDADGAAPVLNISRADDQSMTFLLQHFSGGLLVSGQEALAALGLDASSGAVGYINRIARASLGFGQEDPALTAAVLPIYIEWYEDHVRPLVIASGVTAFISTGREEYEAWRSVARMTGILGQLQPQIDDSIPLVAAYLNRRYMFFNEACLDDPNGNVNSPDGPVADAALALEVRTLARDWQIPLEPNNLDDEFLLDNLCVKVGIDTLLPDNLDRAGDRGSLTVGTHYTIAGGPARGDLPMHVQLSRGSSAFGSPSSGRVDSAGFFDSQITWPAGVDPLTIDVLARLDGSGFRRIRRFDRVTIGCTAPEITSVDRLSGDAGPGEVCVFRAETVGQAESFAWNFGGGATPNTSTAREAVVTFGNVGTYTGSLTVGVDCASTEEFPFTYTVFGQPYTEREFVGRVVIRMANGTNCEGPSRARFEFETESEVPEFRIDSTFDCPGRTGQSTVTFLLSEESVTQSSFQTHTPSASGQVTCDEMHFQTFDAGINLIFFGHVAP